MYIKKVFVYNNNNNNLYTRAIWNDKNTLECQCSIIKPLVPIVNSLLNNMTDNFNWPLSTNLQIGNFNDFNFLKNLNYVISLIFLCQFYDLNIKNNQNKNFVGVICKCKIIIDTLVCQVTPHSNEYFDNCFIFEKWNDILTDPNP